MLEILAEWDLFTMAKETKKPSTEVWEPLRTRDKYKDMTNELNEHITRYYEHEGDISHREAVCLAAFRLMKYIKGEVSGLVYPMIEKDKVPTLTDAIMEYYCVNTNNGGVFQEEVSSLECLSRAAYREFKRPLEETETQTEYHHDIM